MAGPARLGRSVLVLRGESPPEAWSGCEHVSIDGEALLRPEVLSKVRTAFLGRTRMVFELEVDFRAPLAASSTGETWQVPIDHDFVPEAIWQLATRNAVDARDRSHPSWTPSRIALELGARPPGNVDADVLLPDGQAAWCDGGPLTLWSEKATLGLEHVVVPAAALERGLLQPTHVDQPLTQLASDQLAAIGDIGIRSRIIAPAGSGKTRVLTERARHLVRSGVPVESLLLVAYNKRAQEEIRERTVDLVGLRVRTLNALGLAVINGPGAPSSRGDRRTTISERDVRALLASMLKFPRRANTDPQAAWIDALSSVRLGLQDPRAVESQYSGDVEGFANFFPSYRAELRRRGQVDFDEQIYLAIETLLADGEARRQVQRGARVLLVDEFQDLTPSHMLLIRLLAGPELGIFGVGDDDQTIYGYSGASPEWLVNFDHYVPAATHHALTVNYRCPAPVVEAAKSLLARNQLRVRKEIAPASGAVLDVSSMQVIRSASPFKVATDVVRDLINRGAAPSEIAVLSRVNSLLAPVHAGLVEGGLNVVDRDGLGFIERTGVAAALSWLRIAATPSALRSADVARAARRPTRGISPRVVGWMTEQRNVADLGRLADRITDDKASDKVAGFARDVERISALATTASAARILEFVRSEIGLGRSMQRLDVAHLGRNGPAHADDLRALIALGDLHVEAASFTSWLADVLRPSNAKAGVTLASVHKVKGQEWPHVVVLDVTQGVFPHRLSTDIEEERRIFHVAMTRCKQTLNIVADAAAPSLFLDELSPMKEPLPASEAPRDEPGASSSEGSARKGEAAIGAVVGLIFMWGGYRCEVLSVDESGVVAAVNASRIAIVFGSEVTVDARRGVLRPPKTGGSKSAAAGDSGVDEGLFQSLKEWRRGRSRADNVPAYVVAHDSTLAAIAALRPRTESELLKVSGMGPKRVEAYGDEILAAIEDADSTASH
jgi:DNA helicase II / ATP-dependent DNA helicase PcrA